ncbi:F0F1 ATP synthase subunit delta [Methylosinus sp. R-45379]|uniref:F0F1 ATP synthase subunit delta n=1 Tax=unclassified Methylosinus TaxID=2624500 RepID=UPI00047E0454|nr:MULTISPECIES: F0F1 ATP synthase subunit delta [unclassified Methylosinus]OAI26589.1 F0F1 ATP synthase subunit delta [Methylosinus sp. R-45379]TDX67602.1 ATP synthase F1 subcomplex delta subunit [Methylosinus sp. sav-2]
MASGGDDLSGVAGRYASALYDLAVEKGSTDEIATALRGFAALIQESADLERLIESPIYSAETQIKALSPILDAAGVTGVAANFVKLVATKRRLFVLPAIIEAYGKLHDAAKGIVRADVTVAAPLASHHESALRDALAGVTSGKTIDLEVKVDPAIIGGLVVKIGSRMLDASLKTKLNSIRTRMKEVG